MRRSLSKRERLRNRLDIERVFSSGRKYSCPGARLMIIENGLQDNRIVVAPVRKIGNSVVRNHVKRLGKEAYRNIKSEIRCGYDFAVILFPGEYGFEERKNQISSLIKRAGLYITNGE